MTFRRMAALPDLLLFLDIRFLLDGIYTVVKDVYIFRQPEKLFFP